MLKNLKLTPLQAFAFPSAVLYVFALGFGLGYYIFAKPCIVQNVYELPKDPTPADDLNCYPMGPNQSAVITVTAAGEFKCEFHTRRLG